MSLRLEALREDHFERLHVLFDSVCRERRFLAFTEAGPREQTHSYYRNIVNADHIHFVALDGSELLGWCDILPVLGQVRSHIGVLGMAVAGNARGRGIGRQLIEAALTKSADRGLTRVELTVHSENLAAQTLYRSVGFQQEGILRNAWRLDDRYYDVLFMARLR